MIVIFDKTYLKELYEVGCCSEKKYRYQPDIVKRYQRRIVFMSEANSIQDLKSLNSLNFEALSGDKKGTFSVRVNNKYRIEFLIDENLEDTRLTICNITELSNHYK
jgi:proteic killer suppression protein